jgi:4-amino-4-deoxychorismate lyase
VPALLLASFCHGCVAEGPTTNVPFVRRRGEGDLVVPAFDKVLSGCTTRWVLTLALRLVEAGLIRSAGNARIPAGDGGHLMAGEKM